MRTKDRIKLHEGKRNKPYLDSEGILTIGYGRNLRDIGISDTEAEYLFANDYQRAVQGARGFPVYESLDRVRQGVLQEMVFQMGTRKVRKFKRFLAAARAGDWELAASEMLDSKWATQTPKRAKKLTEIFRSGK